MAPEHAREPDHVDEQALEPVSGEVLPPVQPTAGLDPRHLQAAVADAAGVQRKDIAVLVGVSESAIKQWRAKPAYQQEVERLRQLTSQEISAPLLALKKDVLAAASEAVATLRENLKAEDDRGRPKHTIRKEAAALLLQYGFELERASSGGGEGSGSVAQAGAAVTLTITDERG